MLEKIGSQLKAHGRDEDPARFFDDVVFCTNVTYASGNYKGGACLSPPLSYPHSRAAQT